MRYDWITIALENGGVLTASKDATGINASMHWENGAEICGDNHSTLPDALTSLNSELEDDAAEECCPSNTEAIRPLPSPCKKEPEIIENATCDGCGNTNTCVQVVDCPPVSVGICLCRGCLESDSQNATAQAPPDDGTQNL